MSTIIVIKSFNPRARDGRESMLTLTITAWRVSIHAPVMDAKLILPILLTLKISFNPRARDGREQLLDISATDALFQSTRP